MIKIVLAVAVSVSSLTLATAAAGASEVSIPSSVNSTCTKNVSYPLQKWLSALPPGTTVNATGCYEVNAGIILKDATGLTISGGTFNDPSIPKAGGGAKDGPQAILWFQGGSDVTVTGATIEGANKGGYHPPGAFESGIRDDGVVAFDAQHDTISNTFGDGIELNALRANNDDSGTIIRPATWTTIQFDTITDAGRQGISMEDVKGANVDSITITKPGINAFDLEADQGNEGVRHLTIDGCTTSGGNGFFGNGGAGSGQYTGNITVENCKMKTIAGGDPILVEATKGSVVRGPFTFDFDKIICGDSVYVACIQDGGGEITVENSTLNFPSPTGQEAEYHVAGHGSVTLLNVTTHGKIKA